MTEIEFTLAKKFGLKEAIVVHITEFDRVSPLDQLGAAGARYLTTIVDRHRILGVTWGSTVSYVAKNLLKALSADGFIMTGECNARMIWWDEPSALT